MGFEIVDRRGEKRAAEKLAERLGNEADRATALRDPGAALERLEIAKRIMTDERPKAKGTAETRNFEWRSTGYTLVYLMVNKNQMMAGRAVGLRTDQTLFTADWLLPPLWDEKLSWQWEARRRLDTFRKCSCASHKGPCDFHRTKIPGAAGPGQWLVEDMQRLQTVQAKPLPLCLEILMKAEMASSQARIVAPGA